MNGENNKLIMKRELAKINKDFVESLKNYHINMKKSELDAPLEVLCLPKDIMNILERHGLIRVVDIFDLDLTKIKGLGKYRIAYINSKFQEFFPM